MTLDQLIDDTLTREGGYREDRGGPTAGGVTLASWQAYTGRPATADDIRALTVAQKRAFYTARFTQSPFWAVPDEAVKVFLLDWGVNSGEARVCRWLQRTLNVAPVDGIYGPRTHAAVLAAPAGLLVKALVGQRCAMLSGALRDGTVTRADFAGLVARAVSFV